MSSSGLQKVFATEGNTEAALNYSELKDIISNATQIPFKVVIERIAGISSSTFYGYVSKTPSKRGHISLYTCNNLSNYFGISEDVFLGKRTISKNEKEIIIRKIKNDFKCGKSFQDDSNQVKKADIQLLKNVGLELLKSSDVDILVKSSEILKALQEMAEYKIKSLKKIESL